MFFICEELVVVVERGYWLPQGNFWWREVEKGLVITGRHSDIEALCEIHTGCLRVRHTVVARFCAE